jgi:hypothetical protein
VFHVPAKAGIAVMTAKRQKRVIRGVNPDLQRVSMEHSFENCLDRARDRMTSLQTYVARRKAVGASRHVQLQTG